MTGVNLTLSGRRFASVLPPPLSRIQEAIAAQPLLADASLLALFDTQAYATGDLSEASDFDEVFDFSRAYVGYAFNVSQTLTEYAVDVPRFEYDPLTTAPKGLLIEPAQTNQSKKYYVSASDMSVNDGVTSATVVKENPVGASTVIESTATAGAAEHMAVFSGGTLFTIPAAAGEWLFSPVVKVEGADYVRIAANAGAAGIAIDYVFSVVDGSLVRTFSAGTATFSENVGDGWWRFAIRDTSGGGAASGPVFEVGPHDGTASASWTAAGTEKLFLTGVQIEQGNTPSSPIITTGTTATRAADLLEVKPAVVADVVSATAGTVFAEATVFDTGAAQDVINVYAGGDNRIKVFVQTSGNIFFSVHSGGVLQVVGNSFGTITFGEPFRIALQWAGSRISASLDGASVGANSGISIPLSYTDIYLGRSHADTQYAAAKFKTFTYIPRALTDAELQAITS